MPERADDHAADDSLYGLYRSGMSLLEHGDHMAAVVPLEKVVRQAPEKSSAREALGRAYFHSRRFEAAAREFSAVVERHPTNDFAHFCLGRSLSLTGDTDAARRHLALASGLRPDRQDYRAYRDRARRAA